MTFNQAVDYIYASYMKAEPYLDYNAPDSVKRNPELSRGPITKRQGVPTALVTGSKGKGSVSKMIADILTAGYQVGLMTSPHILDFCERFCIQGKPVSHEAFIKALRAVKPEFDQIEQGLTNKQYISPMGIQTAVALELFGRASVDFQVLECGKGVACDDVGQVAHKYSVINRIFLEHTRELGATIQEIAQNKAAIITGGQKAVFTSEQSPEVMEILTKRAELCQVPLYKYGVDFWCENISFTKSGIVFDVITSKHTYRRLKLRLLGTFQARNCALAIALCEMELGRLDEEALKQTLLQLAWPGRLELLSQNPVVLLDACIHPDSCGNMLEAIEKMGLSKVTTIIGIPFDKNYLGVVEKMTSVSDKMILSRSTNPHYHFDKEQAVRASKIRADVLWTEGIKEAMETAYQWDNPICILGTTSFVSDVLALAATPRLL